MKDRIMAFLLLGILAFLYSCGAKIDLAVLDASLSKAQSAITDAKDVQVEHPDEIGAEDIANQQLVKAERLLAAAQKAREYGNLRECLELAFQAEMEAKIAAAQSQRIIIEHRIEELKSEKVKADLSRMAHQVIAAQARQAIAQYKAEVAQKNAETARLEAASARAEAARQIQISKVELAISKADLALKSASEAEAPRYSTNLFTEAQKLVNNARELLSQDKFEQAINTAMEAEQQAHQARVAAVASAEAIRTNTQAAKQKAFTDAKVALTKAQMAVERADEVNASMYAEELYQKAQQALAQANNALKSEQYERVLALAAQTELHANDAWKIAAVKEQERKAKEAKEELIARAKDAIFIARDAIIQAGSDFPKFFPESFAKAQAGIDAADKAYNAADFEQAITLANQSAAEIADAIEKAESIREVESAIIKAGQVIAAAKTERTERGVVIRFSGDMFASGSVDVNPKYFPDLQILANILKQYSQYKVVIEGHTDRSGSSQRNLELSQKRAENILRYLVDKQGVPEDRLTKVGYGDKNPIFPNPKDQRNRRIDVVILTRQK
ncbi:MAG: OmpA family protein [Candidatus Poribacteria bacterium]